MTLTEFLLARIDEDEAVARAAASSELAEWEHAEVSYSWRIQSVAVDRYGNHASITHDREGLSDSVDEDAGPHIARWDPARVLADVAAKRRIIDQAFEVAAQIDGEWGCCHDPEAIRSGQSLWDDEPEPLPIDCCGPKVAERFLKPLALPYANRLDFDPIWATP